MKKWFEKFITKLKNYAFGMFLTALISILLIAFMFNLIVYNVYPGEAAVFWSRFFGGTDISYVHKEGIHFILPWDKMYIYNIRIQETKPEMDVLTKNGLQVHIMLSIRYAPVFRLLGVLHQQVGSDYANKVIIPEIEAVIREIIGTLDAEEVYTTGRSLIIQAINKAIEQVAQRFINIDDVLIRRIELPPEVAESIGYKIRQKHLAEAHTYIIQREKKEATRKEIEAQGIRNHLDKIVSSKHFSNEQFLRWKGIQATENLANSQNAKIVIIGSGKDGLPLILNTDSTPPIIPPSANLSDTATNTYTDTR
ncbi:membrane protease subunit stomatin/prohibitin-like protein [Candidatus Magnetomorum sp. HK-1]|nr:membrane protease subunit stomatin/prohibitin-like protein [Candidatus Magnetomorum sp. HK-1]